MTKSLHIQERLKMKQFDPENVNKDQYGNLDFKNSQNKISINDLNIRKNTNFDIITGNTNIKLVRKNIHTDLNPGEIKVIKIYK